MHTEMWEHPAVQENLATLRRRGVHGRRRPSRAAWPGGDVGVGRLADPAAIVGRRARDARRRTATSPGAGCSSPPGGTREPIDPVRYITNRSSGKQGHALADAAAAPRRRGHPGHHVEPPLPPRPG